jgi:hypothetical protein
MARSKQYLAEQIDRAKRFAAAMNTEADRRKFEKLAAGYQSELDAAETAESHSSAAAPETAPSEAAPPTNEAVAAGDETGASDAVAPQPPPSSDDQEPTTD